MGNWINNNDYDSKFEEKLMKRVTITYTKQSLDTPWYWQVASTALWPIESFLSTNNSQLETYTKVEGNTNIVYFTFQNEQIYEEFKAMIETNIAPDYLQYCQENNITIGVLTEDI